MKFFFHSARLIEAKDKSGKDWEVVLIQAGKSLNNKIYPAEVLKKAVKLFNNVKAFAYEFPGKIFNHFPENARKVVPEGCARNVVGWYDNPRYASFKDSEGKTHQGIVARFHVSEGAQWLRKLLKDAWQYGKHSLLGFSIDGSGDVSETTVNGKRTLMVNSINSIDEVTLVTHPAAGGQFKRLLASKNFIEEEEAMNFLKELYNWVKNLKEGLIEGVDPEHITEEQEFSFIKFLVENEKFPPKEKLEEAGPFVSATIDRLIEMLKGNKQAEALKLLTALKEKLTKYGYPSVAKYYGYPTQAQQEEEKKRQAEAEAKKTKDEEAKKVKEEEERRKQLSEIEKVKEDVKKMQEDTLRANCRALLAESLASSDLPQPVKDKVSKLFEGKIFTKEELEKAIDLEKEVLGKLSESGDIKGLGQRKESIEVIKDSADKIQVAMDKLIDDEAEVPEKMKDIPAFTSLKEAYRTYHPDDPTISGNIDRRKHAQRLTEAITTGDFTYALGTSMTRKLVKAFKKVAFDFANIVTETGIDNFKQQERVKWGGYSTLPTITEDAAYTDLYEPRDEEATYTAGTKGGYVSVSRRAIKNDDLGLLKRIPTLVGTAAKRTLSRDVSGLLTANGTYTPTNSTVFSTLFGNYSTRALNYDNFVWADIALRGMKERGSAQDAGTATAASSTTLTDSSKSWTVDAFIGYYVRIVYGTGAGQVVAITDNDATSVTVAAWTTTPDTTSRYEISTAQNDDEVIGFAPRYLVYGLQLQRIINALQRSDRRYDNAENEDNFFKRQNVTPIFNPYLTGSTTQYYWYLIAGKDQTDIIEIGYVDNQRTPTLVIQDQPALGEVFTNDKLRWKIRYEYGLAIIENKAIIANEATTV
jgi:hypothetical protein